MNNIAFKLLEEKVKNHHRRFPGADDAGVWQMLSYIIEEVNNELNVAPDVHLEACAYAQMSPTFDRKEELYHQPRKLAVYDAYVAGWKANI